MSHDISLTGRRAHDRAGEELVLLPDRAVYWPSRATLLVADPHFGKAAAFRVRGLFVPPGTTAAALSRLSKLLVATSAEQIVFLGISCMRREGRSTQMFGRGGRLAEVTCGDRDDAGAGQPRQARGRSADGAGVRCRGCAASGRTVRAGASSGSGRGHYVLAGHIHPCVTVRGARTGKSASGWRASGSGAQAGVLPAFGEFTGCAEIAPVVR